MKPVSAVARLILSARADVYSNAANRGRTYLVVSSIGDRGRRQTDGFQKCIYHRHRQSHELSVCGLAQPVRNRSIDQEKQGARRDIRRPCGGDAISCSGQADDSLEEFLSASSSSGSELRVGGEAGLQAFTKLLVRKVRPPLQGEEDLQLVAEVSIDGARVTPATRAISSNVARVTPRSTSTSYLHPRRYIINPCSAKLWAHMELARDV
jgi:hypothetical protein